MTLDCEVVQTRSGAVAMLDRNTGEVMHPVVGARAEARLLYAEGSRLHARLLESEPSPLLLFDVGLGAGSNAVAAFEVAHSLGDAARRLTIVSFDQSLAALECALRPEYAEAFGLDRGAGAAARALLEGGDYRDARTTWRLRLGDLPATLSLEEAASVDLVYWDPFSPSKNPTLWTTDTFRALRGLCRPGATLFTYSAATATRSALLLAGFAVGEGDVTGIGKRTTQAALSVNDLERPLGRRWFERLARSSAAFPNDAPPDALARVRELPQFS